MRRPLCCNCSGAHRRDPSFLPSLAGATNPQSTCACLHSWPQRARPSSLENSLVPPSAPRSQGCRVSVLCTDLDRWPFQASGRSDAGTRAGRLCQWPACVRQGLRTQSGAPEHETPSGCHRSGRTGTLGATLPPEPPADSIMSLNSAQVWSYSKSKGRGAFPIISRFNSPGFVFSRNCP